MEDVSSKQNEPVVQNLPSKQTEPAAQLVPQEPIKQILGKDKSPPPPLSTEKVQEECVSVDKVSEVRTSSETSDSVKSDSKESGEETPEVNIVPPTPVEKEMKIEVPTPTTEVQKPTPTTEPTETAKEVTGMYRKGPKFLDTRKLCCNLPKFRTKSLTVLSQEDANGIAKSEDPDQTAPLGAV